jgi:hypothetical protein
MQVAEIPHWGEHALNVAWGLGLKLDSLIEHPSEGPARVLHHHLDQIPSREDCPPQNLLAQDILVRVQALSGNVQPATRQ